MFENIQVTDFMILDWIQTHLRCGWLDWLMPKITMLGEAGILWIVIALLFLWRKPWRKCGLKLFVSLLICLVLGLVLLKNMIARPRPCWINTDIELLVSVPGDYSFPSGHTWSGISSALIILMDNRRRGIAAMIMAVVIAFSRLYLYVHFPSDVLAGAVFGVLMALLTEKVVERYLPKMPAKVTAFFGGDQEAGKAVEKSGSETGGKATAEGLEDVTH
jgi:undecaprenyl-diphosphatase